MRKDRQQYIGDFSARLRELIFANWKSWREAAAALGEAESTLSRLGRGEGEPPAGLLLALSEKLNVSMSYLLGVDDDPRPPPPAGMVRKAEIDMSFVPNLDARAAAGAGAVSNIVAVERVLPFPLWMLQKLAPPGAKMSFVRAVGDSMEPTFHDGALLLVNENDSGPPRCARPGAASDIFVFLQGDQMRVKRLRARREEILAFGDNRAYDPEILRGPDLKHFKIIGRVVWWDDRL